MKPLVVYASVTVTVTVLHLVADVACQPPAGASGGVQYTKFIGKQIDPQVELLSIPTISVDQDLMCAQLCSTRKTCFAVQYVSGSYVCQLQLNCGLVSLQSATTNSTVIVPSWLLTNAFDFRPLLLLPLVKGCNSNFSTNFGTRPTSFSPATGIVTRSNAYSAIAETISLNVSPNVSAFNLQSGTLPLTNSPFTISFLFQQDSWQPEVGMLSFMTPTYGSQCFTIRIVNQQEVWFGFNACGCSPAYRLEPASFTRPSGWTHIALVYTGSSVAWYLNGQSIYTASYTFTTQSLLSSRILFGGMSECSNYWNPLILAGSMACVMVHNASLTQTQVNMLYKQCLYGSVLY